MSAPYVRTSATCPTCAKGPTRRYCAPARCYCAHDDCPAEWSPLPALSATPDAPTPAPTAKSWANREDSTWIDKL